MCKLKSYKRGANLLTRKELQLHHLLLAFDASQKAVVSISGQVMTPRL